MCLACDNLCCISAATAQCGCNECPEKACHDPDSDEADDRDPTPNDEPSPMQFSQELKLTIQELGFCPASPRLLSSDLLPKLRAFGAGVA
jgi:hypothetical protein